MSGLQPDTIALQLYTVREQTAKDMLGTLRRLAEMGYRAVEFAGYGGVPVGDIRAVLDETGLRAMGAHVQFAQFETRLQEVFAELRTLGCEYAVVPSLPRELRGSAEQTRQLPERFNRWGERCQAEGFRFGYHNHSFEFEPLGDGTLFDTLATGTDPDLVALELDIYWAQYAGVDPVELIGRYPGRMPLLHLKDMTTGPGGERADAPVGAGELPWERILAAAPTAGARWFIVEQDHPRDPMEDVRTSLRNLQRMASTA
jgi:sugar phosphate isomerase/epimerase